MWFLQFPGGASGKGPAWKCRVHKKHRFSPWVQKITCRRACQSTPVFLPGDSNGQRSLAGYGPQSHEESVMTEATWHARMCYWGPWKQVWADFFYKGPCSTYFWLWSLAMSAQSCPILCDPLDCLLSDSTILGILQARILEWVAISSSRGSSSPRDQTQVRISWISRWIVYHWDSYCNYCAQFHSSVRKWPQTMPKWTSMAVFS